MFSVLLLKLDEFKKFKNLETVEGDCTGQGICQHIMCLRNLLYLQSTAKRGSGVETREESTCWKSQEKA